MKLLLPLLLCGALRAQCPAVPATQYPTLEQVLNDKPCMSGGGYSNPAWITALAFAKITGVPSFEPAIAAGTTGQFWRGDKSWQTPPFEPPIAAGTTLQYFRGDKSLATFSNDALAATALILPQQLPKWRLALAAMRTGVRDAKILCIGDSTTAGTGSSQAGTSIVLGSYPQRLATLLNLWVPSAVGLGIPNLNGGTDNRWTVGAGWVLGGTGVGWATGANFNATAPAGALGFAPNSGALADGFDVYYSTAAGGGTISLTATGGTPVPVLTATGAAGTIQHATAFAAAALTTNTVSITATGGLVSIVGVEPFLSTARKIRVGNAGIPSSRANQWTVNFSNTSGPSIRGYAPDLCLISLGINDAGATGDPAATLSANLATLATFCRASGDVILVTMPPSGPPASTQTYTLELLYQPAIAALAASLNIPVLDIFGRWGGTLNSNFTNSDGLHPLDVGYSDIASAADGLLQRAR